MIPDALDAGACMHQALPLVLISHGNGGGAAGHADLAMALAAAGYVVAAPMHTGDNFLDQSALATPGWLAGRNRELRASVDYLLGAWGSRARLDPSRIGAYGFSAGGYTVLAAAGARPDLGMIPDYCARQPEFACELLRQAKSPLLQAGASIPAAQPDARIRAAVVAAPATYRKRAICARCAKVSASTPNIMRSRVRATCPSSFPVVRSVLRPCAGRPMASTARPFTRG